MSIPFFGKEFSFKQPDGTYLRVRGSGDEHHAMFKTFDGRPVVKDPATGFYKVSTPVQSDSRQAPTLVGGLVADARTVAPGLPRGNTRWETRRRREKEALRLASADPNIAFEPPQRHTTGTFVGLCLLVQFPDVPGTITQAEVTAFCNKQGYTGFGNNGSVHDYFLDVSGGKLQYTNLVAPYYTARNPRDHYTDPSVAWPVRAAELIREALEHLIAGGFDVSRLTVDSENFVYAINVFYAGPLVNEWSQGLWPHASGLPVPIALGAGKLAHDYQITNMDSELTLGTFCHENGHMVCDFPDLYDYGPQSFGVGRYCLMCTGGNADPKNPVHIGAYLKFKAGWASSVKVISAGTQVTLAAGRNDVSIFQKSPTEYFLFESRHADGRDQALGVSGLAIWHVDELGNNSNEQMTPALHYECSLAQADGSNDLERGTNDGDEGDLYPSGGSIRFADDTSPSSRWWDGTSSGLTISDISAAGPIITFSVEVSQT